MDAFKEESEALRVYKDSYDELRDGKRISTNLASLILIPFVFERDNQLSSDGLNQSNLPNSMIW